jgi:hypothetical protein
MPYNIRKVGTGKHKGEYRLSKKDDPKKALGYHTTREKATKQIQAIEISKKMRKK